MDEVEVLFQAGDYRGALEKTDEAIQPNIYVSPIAYLRKTTLHYMLGEKASALESYQSFLRKSPAATESPEIDLARTRIKQLGGIAEW